MSNSTSCPSCTCNNTISLLAERSSGIEYRIFNDRCVKATLSFTYGDAHEALFSILSKRVPDCTTNEEIKTFIEVLLPYNEMECVYSGKATVNVEDGDSFDIGIGKTLAKTRLLKKYHKDFDSSFTKALLRLRTFVAAIEHYCKKHRIDISKIPSVEELEDRIYNSGSRMSKP